MSLPMVSSDSIQKKLSTISIRLGVVLRYRLFEMDNGSGEKVFMHTVSRAQGKKWIDITDPVKTQRVLWKKITIWEELTDAVTQTRRYITPQDADLMEEE